MHNLLPEKNKRRIKSEYRLRLTVLFFFGSALSGIVLAAAMLPSYISMQSREEAVVGEYLMAKNSTSAMDEEDLARISEETNEKILSLKSFALGATVSNYVDTVFDIENPGINITGFTFVGRQNEEKADIVVEGVASSRDALVLFKSNLEKQPIFGAVSLPVSNLAKQTDINFNIKLEVKNR